MLSRECLTELRERWLPNVTDAGLTHLTRMVESGSPLLVRGCFSRGSVMGCLATRIAWDHPRTQQYHHDAGIRWLTDVVGINPSQSHVIREWDQSAAQDSDARAELARELRAEQERRRSAEVPESITRRGRHATAHS